MKLYAISGGYPGQTLHPGGIEWPAGWPLPNPGHRLKLDGESWEVVNIEFEPAPAPEGVGYGIAAPEPAVWVRVQKPYRADF